LSKLRDDLRCLVDSGHFPAGKAADLLDAVEKRHLSLNDASDQIQKLMQERLAPPANVAKN
jgi:hypothetical protein